MSNIDLYDVISAIADVNVELDPYGVMDEMDDGYDMWLFAFMETRNVLNEGGAAHIFRWLCELASEHEHDEYTGMVRKAQTFLMEYGIE